MEDTMHMKANALSIMNKIDWEPEQTQKSAVLCRKVKQVLIMILLWWEELH